MKTDDIIGKIIAQGLKTGLSKKDCTKAVNIKKAKYKQDEAPFNRRKFFFVTGLIVVLYSIANPTLYRRPQNFFENFIEDYIVTSTSNCILGNSAFTFAITRAVSNCNVCKGIKEVSVVKNMSREYFLEHHAYTGSPVLIKGGAENWTALNIFSYEYFKLLYEKLEASEENDELGCQFFPYKTNFKTLKHVFQMSKKRAALKKDQWYVGWSNCVPRVAKALRKHYSRPNFLPNDSELSHLDWMFMGGSGTGAQMHIDAVDRPSWQAMIKGRKTWYLEPPPECAQECLPRMNVTMEPGDILVVDTNRWYHSTFIYPGNLSVTIGSEYD